MGNPFILRPDTKARGFLTPYRAVICFAVNSSPFVRAVITRSLFDILFPLVSLTKLEIGVSFMVARHTPPDFLSGVMHSLLSTFIYITTFPLSCQSFSSFYSTFFELFLLSLNGIVLHVSGNQYPLNGHTHAERYVKSYH